MVYSSISYIGKHFDASPSFDDVMRFRCPPILPSAVKMAAARQMVSMSCYIRTAVVERLKKDGVDVANMKAVA
jgi:hypothetical protein